MTFDAAVQTDWGTAIADLRDKLGGMTNWAIYDDNTGGAASIYNDWFVLETATGEYIRIRESSGGLRLEYGPDWNDTDSTWNDQYSYPNGGVSPSEHSSVQETDAFKYWLEYVERGFVFYGTRESGETSDYEVCVGFAEISPLWDYSSATARESDMVFTMFGMEDGDDHTDVSHHYTGEARDSGDTADAVGIVNPDGNFSNFPTHETNVVASSRYQNANGQDAYIGTHNLWIRDHSGSDSAHLDTITEGGTDKYTIVKEYGTLPLAIRMD